MFAKTLRVKKQYPVLVAVRDRVPKVLSAMIEERLITDFLPSQTKQSFYVIFINGDRRDYIRLRINVSVPAKLPSVRTIWIEWNDSDDDIKSKIVKVLY